MLVLAYFFMLSCLFLVFNMLALILCFFLLLSFLFVCCDKLCSVLSRCVVLSCVCVGLSVSDVISCVCVALLFLLSLLLFVFSWQFPECSVYRVRKCTKVHRAGLLCMWTTIWVCDLFCLISDESLVTIAYF